MEMLTAKHRSLRAAFFFFKLVYFRHLPMTWLYNIALLNPQGLVALNERNLIYQAVFLMLIIVVPVFALAFSIAWHYRADNTKAVYMPDWEHSKMDELIWWAIPLEIILVLGALTWTSTHALDPRKPLDSQVPLKIEVVALDWKCLFIYPDQNIATVNFVEIPVNRPVEFDITADAPMNSFWIPQLGGQIYAMTGMSNALNLEANTVGDFPGRSSNYSGEGFAQMQFTARAASSTDFDAWVKEVKQSPQALTTDTYAQLSKPSIADPSDSYATVETNLYNKIVTKFMSPNDTTMHMSQ
jgi:cytochrome o ubiquinol oxidase subunit 2